MDQTTQTEKQLLNIVISGTNKGLGFELVKQLCEQQSEEIKFNLIITSRDLARGQKAETEILQQFPALKNNIFYHLLDITNKESINTFYEWYSKKFQKLDILVNNAALGTTDFFNKDLQSPEIINPILDCNIYGTIDMTEKMLPLLASNGKIIIVSSMLGSLSFQGKQFFINKYFCIQGEQGRKLLSDPTMTKEKLYQIVENYRKIGPTQEVINQGFSPKSYFLSKAAINAYTRFILSKQMQKDQLAINVHPGWCRTDLGTQQATLSAGEGAEMIRFVVLDIPFEANEKYNGSFWVQGNQKAPSDF